MLDSDSDPLHARIARNLEAIRARIRAAAARAGRDPDAVRLVAVTKSVDLPAIEALYALGVRDFGENRVEGAAPKIAAFSPPDARWRMIGPIQRRKARDVVRQFHAVDAVDRVAVAETLQRRCEEQDKRLPILVEVNVSGEAAKHGFAPGTLDAALRGIGPLDRLEVRGLMTMAPHGADEATLRAVFGALAALARERDLPEVSMGMSDDFEFAVEEGATQVRIGGALFA